MPRHLVLALLLCATPLTGVAQAIAPASAAPLDRLIDTSLVASPVLNAKRSELAVSRSDIDAARWQYTPSVSAEVQQGSGPSSLNGRVLRIDQKLYAGGRLDAELQGATARRDSAVHAVRESALALALQIVGSYQSLAAANGQLAAIGAYRLRLDALDGTITRRIDSGVSAAADRSLMSARQAQSQNDLASARAAQRSAIATLERLVGDPAAVATAAASVVEAVGSAGAASSLAAVCGTDAEADTRLNAALALNPSLARIERDIESARAAVDAQRAALRPVVGLRVEQPIAPAADAVLRSARLSVVVGYTPDAGLSSLARAQGASERVNALVYQADALRRDAVQQIRGECAEQSGVIDRVAGFALARGYTSEVLASSTRLFIAGRRGWLDLLNAAREDFDNEQAGITAGAALLGSQYRLALLTGERPLALPGVADEPASDLTRSIKALLR